MNNLRYIFALELIHAAQAVDYRKGRVLGPYSGAVFNALRIKVDFYDHDRNTTEMIQSAYGIIADEILLNIVTQ